MPKHLIPSNLPAGLLNAGGREPFPRLFAGADLAALTSGVETMVALPVYKGEVVTTISFLSGATGATYGTAADQKLWFVLRDSSGNKLSQTPFDITAWGANTLKSLDLAAPQSLEEDGFVFAGCMVDVGTGGSPVINTLRGVTAGAAVAVQPGGGISMATLAGTSGSGLTTTAPSGPLTPTPVVTVPWCLLT